ncbi:hypothetical protein HDU84_002844 [Entophlyctis sp. JEL0112]|nr:hypothetical protein HDU84_002844 [Entophlyctis sp. JEL0112]
MLLVYYVFLSPSSPSPSSNATQKPQPPALGSILTTTSMQPISSIASAVGQTAGASLDPSSAAVSTSSSTIDWSVLDDSRSLPVDTAKFSHNYPPFLSTFALSDEDRRSVWDSRADAVKRALSHAWDGYVQYAWGEDELKPISKEGESWLHMGLTILDALDTAWVLGNKTIFNAALNWVVGEPKGLTMDADVNANVFETTIRVVGGLLSAYNMSGDDRLLKEASRVADKFMPAYEKSSSGIPYNSIHLQSGQPSNPGGTMSSTSEATTVQLELKYLSHLTGDPKYWNAAQKVSKALFEAPSDKTSRFDGLVPVFLDHRSGEFAGNEIRLGSRADSYYEYLAKQYLLTNKTEPFFLTQYRYALHSGIKKHLLMRSEPSNLLYIREQNNGKKSEKFDHLVCYFGGTLALTATKGKRVPMDAAGRSKVLSGLEMEELYLAEELARTCYEMYHQTATGLASEIVFWNRAKDEKRVADEMEKTWKAFEGFSDPGTDAAKLPVALNDVNDVADDDLERDFSIHPMDKHNLLRPEAIETFFVLFRITGNEKYREWGWRVFRSFEQWAKVLSGGYTSLVSVPTFNFQTLKFIHKEQRNDASSPNTKQNGVIFLGGDIEILLLALF